MKIALVDDEQEELNHVMKLLKSQLDFAEHTLKIDTFSSGTAFLEAWAPGSYDLLILDIYMDRTDGIAVARRVRETDSNICLVFCTSSNAFASESYEVRAHYYLCKPVTQQGIAAMLERMNLAAYERERLLTLPDGQKVILHNIMYTEYFNHIVTIHNQKGAAVEIRISQKEMERLLCKYPSFCCCSRGIIVNFHAVQKYSADTFWLSSGQTIPISRRRSKEVIDAYTHFLFEKMRAEVKNYATFLPNC